MDPQMRVLLRFIGLPLLGVLTLFGACTCEDDYTYPSTALDRGNGEVDNAVRMRFTESGLQFLQDNFNEILVGVLGDPEETDPDNIVLLFEEPLLTDRNISFLIEFCSR